MNDKAKLQFSFDYKPTGAPRTPDQPMRILIQGNFSGSADSGAAKLKKIDVDNFDDILEQISPCAKIAMGGNHTTELKVGSMDDFHPDEIYRNQALFGELKDLLQRLQNSATFKEAAKEITRKLPESDVPPTEADTRAPTTDSGETDNDTIERLLGRSASTDNTVQTSGSMDSMIRKIVAPHIEPAADPNQASLLRSVEQSISALMGQILHSPRVQALEARWLALHTLVNNPQLDESVQVYLWDCDRETLESMLSDNDSDPRASAAAKLLAGPQGTAKWSVIASELTITTDDADLLLMARLATTASCFGGPVLANAGPSLYGCATSIEKQPDADDWQSPEDSSTALWEQLRDSSIASWIGLCGPRIMQRMPYGEKTDPIVAFNYEELSGTPAHDEFLWGASSIRCAGLLASAYCERQWSMQPGDHLEIDDLPLVTVTLDGQKALMPCTEAVLTERTAQAMIKRGVMPFLSYRNRNAARLFQFRSVSKSNPKLAGPWDS